MLLMGYFSLFGMYTLKLTYNLKNKEKGGRFIRTLLCFGKENKEYIVKRAMGEETLLKKYNIVLGRKLTVLKQLQNDVVFTSGKRRTVIPKKIARKVIMAPLN